MVRLLGAKGIAGIAGIGALKRHPQTEERSVPHLTDGSGDWWVAANVLLTDRGGGSRWHVEELVF